MNILTKTLRMKNPMPNVSAREWGGFFLAVATGTAMIVYGVTGLTGFIQRCI